MWKWNHECEKCDQSDGERGKRYALVFAGDRSL
jgi:hypothetical protein